MAQGDFIMFLNHKHGQNRTHSTTSASQLEIHKCHTMEFHQTLHSVKNHLIKSHFSNNKAIFICESFCGKNSVIFKKNLNETFLRDFQTL